jgi:hypothetical protein
LEKSSTARIFYMSGQGIPIAASAQHPTPEAVEKSVDGSVVAGLDRFAAGMLDPLTVFVTVLRDRSTARPPR